MNNDAHIESLIARRDALNAILLRFTSEGGALTAIADYCDDPASLSSPSMIENINTLLGTNDEDDHDITLAAEMIYLIGGPEIGKRFCDRNELCADHFSDPENCADDH